MFNLLAIELLKVRRSLALLMMALIPTFVVVLSTLMLLRRQDLAALTPAKWQMFWSGNLVLWCSFMLPLYIALATGLLNGQEHRNQTWRLMLTLPVSQPALYGAKLLLAWLFVMGANAVLAVELYAVTALLGTLGARMDGAWAFPALAALAGASLACLPILVLQHAVSWRSQNIVAPLAFGVVATMGVTQIGSSQYWVWYPWSYPLMRTLGSSQGRQDEALLLALAAGLVLALLSTAWLGRRTVRT